MNYAVVKQLADAWNRFRDGELKHEFTRLAEPASKFAPHVQVVTETGARVLANLAFGDALKLTYDAAQHFAHCRTCGETSYRDCDDGGREFALQLGFYFPE